MARSLEGIWRAFTGLLYDGIGPERFDVFIRNARPVTLDEDAFVFHFENTYARDKIETLLRDAVTGVAQRSTNRRVRVAFEVDPESFSTARTAPLREAPRPRRPEATFGSFVAGP
ncbi:MAG TPA: hypothetical protein VEN81_15350, partial [Planctomycetota bacterium]|nr:hypothetical protein [Planctomycetota bacterium]